MTQEIERKYFIDELSKTLMAKSFCGIFKYIEQFYLLVEANHEVRIRETYYPLEKNYKYKLTHKIGKQHNRKEIEENLTLKEYCLLKPSGNIDCIRKLRGDVNWDGLTINIDIFKDYDFYIAEIEFNSEEEYENFSPPDFLQCSDGVIRDVSDIPEFKNSYLAQNPMSTEEYLEKLEVGKDS